MAQETRVPGQARFRASSREMIQGCHLPEKVRLAHRHDRAWTRAHRNPATLYTAPAMVPAQMAKRSYHRPSRDAEIEVCLTMKALLGMPLRQTPGFLRNC
jgi:hypothetical protein